VTTYGGGVFKGRSRTSTNPWHLWNARDTRGTKFDVKIEGKFGTYGLPEEPPCYIFTLPGRDRYDYIKPIPTIESEPTRYKFVSYDIPRAGDLYFETIHSAISDAAEKVGVGKTGSNAWYLAESIGLSREGPNSDNWVLHFQMPGGSNAA
jgi:hypothetical protein